MNAKIQKFSLLALLLLAMSVTGCSDDDGGPPTYSGSTTAAVIDEDNAEDMSRQGSEGSNEAINSDNANDGNPFAFRGGQSVTVTERVVDIIRNVTAQQNNVASGAVITSAELGPEFCGGSLTVPDNTNGTSATIIFNALCFEISVDETITMSGAVVYTETSNGFTIRYVNFVTTFSNGDTETLNMTVTCTDEPFSCSISSDFIGTDGRVYRVADFTVSGNNTTGYDVSGEFYHPDHGFVTFVTDTPIIYNCSNGRPESGQITFTGSGGSFVTITFDDCDSYSGNWDNGTSAGTFSGTWL